MKRKLSLIVLLVFVAVACLGVLAACGGLDDFALETLMGKAEDQFTKAVGTSYTLDSVVKYTDENNKDVTCVVKWTASNGVKIAEGDDVVTVTVPDGVTSYILKGTLVDGKGKSYKLNDEPCRVETSVTVSAGTVNPNPNPNPTPNPNPNPNPTPGEQTVTFDMTGKTTSFVNFTTITEGDITITATDGTGGNTETRYSAYNLRVYYGGTLTISVASGKTIKSITFTTETHDKAIDFTTTIGTYANGSWTGSAASVTFSAEGTKGHVRITEIVVVYA